MSRLRLTVFGMSDQASDADGDDVEISINGVKQTSYRATAPDASSGSITVDVTASDGQNTTREVVTINVTARPGSSGSMSYLVLLLIPLIVARRLGTWTRHN